MSYWNHHPELLEEIAIKNLPEPYKSWCEKGEYYHSDIPNDILFPAMDKGIEDYWASMIDKEQI